MTTVRQDQATYLAAHSGLCYTVSLAWCDIENGAYNNILGVTVNGQLVHYPTWQAGLDAAIARFITLGIYAGIKATLHTGDAQRQRLAIIASPWNAPSHYGNGKHFPSVVGCGDTTNPPEQPTETVMLLDPSIRSDTLVDVAAGGTLYRLNAQGGLVMVAPNWAGQAGLDTYGVQPMATPPRPPTDAPLRFIRCSGTGGVNPYVGMIGEDKCSNIRPRP